jgi:hypothetical protein
MKIGQGKADTVVIAENLLEAVRKAQESLHSVEIWAGALAAFTQPVPKYQPHQDHLLRGGNGEEPHQAMNGWHHGMMNGGSHVRSGPGQAGDQSH